MKPLPPPGPPPVAASVDGDPHKPRPPQHKLSPIHGLLFLMRLQKHLLRDLFAVVMIAQQQATQA
jgi:hypothetical protein